MEKTITTKTAGSTKTRISVYVMDCPSCKNVDIKFFQIEWFDRVAITNRFK